MVEGLTPPSGSGSTNIFESEYQCPLCPKTWYACRHCNSEMENNQKKQRRDSKSSFCNSRSQHRMTIGGIPQRFHRDSTDIPQIFQRFHRSKFIRSAEAEPTTPAIIMPIIGVMMVPSVSAFAGLFELWLKGREKKDFDKHEWKICERI